MASRQHRKRTLMIASHEELGWGWGGGGGGGGGGTSRIVWAGPASDSDELAVLFLLRGFRVLSMLRAMPEKTRNPAALLASDGSFPPPAWPSPPERGFDIAPLALDRGAGVLITLLELLLDLCRWLTKYPVERATVEIRWNGVWDQRAADGKRGSDKENEKWAALVGTQHVRRKSFEKTGLLGFC